MVHVPGLLEVGRSIDAAALLDASLDLFLELGILGVEPLQRHLCVRGLLLLAADIAVRIIPSTSDIKVGVLTSIIGVPFFLYLIMRERRALGGGIL